MKETIRQKLINAIFDMAGDEIETIEDAKKFAKMSDEQLVDEIINIAEYYRTQSNSVGDDFRTFNEAPYGND
jgi:hypothetical protein